jgi:hypothetical protein
VPLKDFLHKGGWKIGGEIVAPRQIGLGSPGCVGRDSLADFIEGRLGRQALEDLVEVQLDLGKAGAAQMSGFGVGAHGGKTSLNIVENLHHKGMRGDQPVFANTGCAIKIEFANPIVALG